MTSLIEMGDLLAPEEAYPRYARVESGGGLLVGHDNGVLSIFEPPGLVRRFVVRSACASPVGAAGRSPSSRFIAIATAVGVTVVDLTANQSAFRSVECAREVAVDDDGTCTAIVEGGARRFDGMHPDAPETTLPVTATARSQRGLSIDDHDRSLRFDGVTLGPPLPDGSVLSSRGVLVARRGCVPRWFDFGHCSSRILDVGKEVVGALAVYGDAAAVGTWSQTVCVMSIADGASWRQKAIRKSDLGGDYVPAFVLTRDGEVVVAQRVAHLLCHEALVWFGHGGRRSRLKLPGLERTLSTLLHADTASALMHVEGRSGLWVFAKGQETQLVPSLDVRWVDAIHERRAFVLRTRERGVVLTIGERVIRLDLAAEGARFTELDRAAFSPGGEWLVLRWKSDGARETRLELWDIQRAERVSSFDVRTPCSRRIRSRREAGCARASHGGRAMRWP